MIRKLFLLWGNEDVDDDDTGDDTGATGSDDNAGDESRAITNSELEAMTARAADKATRKAKRDLASDLGFDNMAGLKEFIGTQKAAVDAATDEQTKALQDAERSKKEYEAGVNDLAEQRLQLSISQAVVGAGLADSKKVQRITALVRDDLDEDILDEEDWSGAVAEALQELQGDMPELFAKPGMGSGDGGAQGASTDDDDDADKDKQLRKQYESQGLVFHSMD